MEPDVKVTLKPSEEVVAKALAEIVTTDSAGRVIKLKKPGVLAQFRLVEAMGGETAKNQTYMGMVLPLIYVASIDGDPIFQPTSKMQMEALIQRLDEHGVDAVMTAVNEHFGAVDPDADKEALKKS
jgi:LDH2 family malate/lactate/ureidoglycolate dehydrogenase